jgi:signal transduction histidine kinase
MPESPLRYKRLIKEIPKHKHAKDAILASGFSESVANSQAKRVLRSAIKYEAKEILENMDNSSAKSKQLMNDIIGLSREELFAALLKIATQDKDYGSALKVLAPLAKQHNVVLGADEDDKSTGIPVLNLSFGSAGPVQPVIDGNVTDLENMAQNIEAEEDNETEESQ